MPGFDDIEEEDDRPRRRAPRKSYHEEDDYDDHLDRGDRLKPHRGPMILVFGILGMMMCGAFGIAAFMMGRNDLREINDGRMDPEGRSLTQVGHILGIIGMVIFCLQLLAFVAYICIIVAVVAAKK